MSTTTVKSRRRILGLPALIIFLVVNVSGCDSGGVGMSGTSGKLEIDPSVISATSVDSGEVRVEKGSTRNDVHFEPYVRVDLVIPDGSPVLQLTSPKADIEVVCKDTAQSVVGIPCTMSVSGGSRSFGFRQVLTSEQVKSLQKIVIKRLYQ